MGVIEAIKAGLIDIASLQELTNRDRLETAFDVAEQHLGIARLLGIYLFKYLDANDYIILCFILDAEDVDVDRPDERSIMTYVAQFLHKYPEPRSDALAELQTLHANLLHWLQQRTQSLHHLIHTNTLPPQYSVSQPKIK